MNDERSELRLRARRLNRARTQTRNAADVLCWLQQALRASDNPMIDAAIAAGNKHNLPVVVYHGLGERYPHASRRLHRFILEASRSHGKGVSRRGLRFASYVERAEKPEPGLMYRLAERAALIVTDDIPAFVGRSQAERVACRVKVPLIAVDAACLVPMNCFPHPTDVTIFFRRARSTSRATHKFDDRATT